MWINPTAWLVSRKLTELAGTWDERLSSSGDDDGEHICRVVAASEKVKFVPQAKCYCRTGNAGSLDWKMGESDERLESLLLLLKFSIHHLLSLEDSRRTRSAALTYLQTWLPFFYPQQTALLQDINGLANRLGGQLSPVEVSWKHYPIKKLFGWGLAEKTMNTWRKPNYSLLEIWINYFTLFRHNELPLST